MYLRLRRMSFTEEGIFGIIFDPENNILFHTLEHSYDCVPKLSAGTYQCMRHPPNRLPYETFEVQGAPPFQGNPVDGILIHIGNYNADSEGCILVGEDSAMNMVTNSKMAFAILMELQSGVDEFTLTVS